MTTEKQPHIHAELAIQHWTLAAVDKNEYRNWQYFREDLGDWKWCVAIPTFCEFTKYRRIEPQKYIKVGDEFVPAPYFGEMEIGQKYFAISNDGTVVSEWEDDLIDHKRMENGRIHLSEENAQKHFDAQKKVNTTIVEMPE